MRTVVPFGTSGTTPYTPGRSPKSHIVVGLSTLQGTSRWCRVCIPMRMHPCYLRTALLRLPAALFLSIAVAGCGSSPAAPTPPTPAPASDAVSSVTNMNPAPGTALQLGQTVTFAGTPAYTLMSADVGAMRMVIQDQANRVLQSNGTQVIVAVTRGTGDV